MSGWKVIGRANAPNITMAMIAMNVMVITTNIAAANIRENAVEARVQMKNGR